MAPWHLQETEKLRHIKARHIAEEVTVSLPGFLQLARIRMDAADFRDVIVRPNYHTEKSEHARVGDPAKDVLRGGRVLDLYGDQASRVAVPAYPAVILLVYGVLQALNNRVPDTANRIRVASVVVERSVERADRD